MEEPSLAGCREKQRRGLKHLEDLDRAIFDWLGEPGVDPKPYRISGEFRPKSGEYVFKGQLLKPADEILWGVILGDGLHNLRSALDHLVRQLVLVNNRKSSGENQFPICDTGANYWSRGAKGEDSTRERRLRNVSDAHKAVIDELQPYRTRLPPNALNPLSTLRDLSNHDKHRLVHPTLFAVDFRTSDELDQFFIANTDAGERVGVAFEPIRYDREADVFGVKYSCPGPNPDVSVKGEPPFGIGMSESRARLGGILELGDLIFAIIERFADDFPS
jgi:hypothetical protein